MSSLKKILLGTVACLTTAAPFCIEATEVVPVTKASIEETSTVEVSNVYWRGRGYRGCCSGFGFGFGLGCRSYGYGSYGYGYGYPYGYGYGGCNSCNSCSSCNGWW